MQKRKIAGVVLGAAVLLIAGVLGYRTLQKPEEISTVMEISGQPVVKAEYQLIVEKYQAQVKSRYSTEQVNRKDFWTTEVDGETPLEAIMKLAEDDLIRKKTIASMAEDEDIETESGYEELMKSMEGENASRTGKTASGQVSYGLSSYTESDFYEYAYTQLEAELVEKLKGKQTLTDSELEAEYEKRSDSYRYENGVTVLVAETKSENADLLKEAAGAMQSGKEEEALAAAYPDISFYELEMNSLNTQEGKSGVYSIRWMVAATMQEGQISEVFSAGSNLLAMKCLKREDSGSLSLDTVKGMLESQVKTEAADREIEQYMEKAEVERKDKLLKEAAKEILIKNE